jgi:type I restriction enzyme S subunit
MTAQALKNSILQLAMQGKLVPQDPSDEPASELLKRIKEEKARLIKEGRIRKEKSPTPITEDEKSFEIPDSWEWVKLSQIVYNLGQKIPDEEFCYIDVGSIDNYAGRLSETNTLIKPENAPSRARKVVMHGAILYSCVRPYLLNTCIVDREFPKPPIASTAFAVLMPYEGIYNKYLHLFLRGPSFVSYTNITSTGQAYPAINDKRLYDAVVPVPPLAEQKRIVAKIEELLPLIERYDESEKRLLELNKKFPDELRKAILQQAVQGKLTEQDPHDEPASELLKRIKAEKARLIKEGKIKKEKPLMPISEDEIPYEIPDNWSWARISEICDLNPRNQISDDTEVSFIPMQFIDAGFVNRFRQDISQWGRVKKGFTHLKEGDVVFAKITPCFQNRKSAILTGLKNEYGAGTTELHVLRPFTNLISAQYLLWFVKNGLFIQDGIKNFTGTVGQQRVGTAYISQYLIPIPPLAEQKRIVAKIEELLPICDSLT